MNLVAHALRGEGFDAGEDGTGRGTPLVAATLNAAMGKGKNGQDVGALVPAIVGQAMSAKWAKGSAGPAGDEHHNLIPVPFDATQVTSPGNYSTHAPCMAFPGRMSGTQHASTENVSPALGALNPTAVAYSTKLHNTTSNQAGKVYQEYTASLDSNSPPPALLTSMAVRRMTPLECERLMGFQDSHTDVLNKGKPVADGHRYKALGNSWAVNCARWIGERIASVDCIAAGDAAQKTPPVAVLT